MTAESDAALLQQRRLVDKLPREELEDRWSFSIRLTYSERIHICTQGATYTFITREKMLIEHRDVLLGI